MPHFQEKLYNYEAAPPQEVWENITAELDANEAVKRIHPFRRRSKVVYYSLVAAASLIIIFVSSLFFNNKQKNNDQQVAASTQADTGNSVARIDDSMNNESLASIIKTNKENSFPTETHKVDEKKYFTVAGPGGQPVRISSKAAKLILSADNEYPPRPVWDKKINQWSDIMLSSTISPTATNLLDIVQFSSLQSDK